MVSLNACRIENDHIFNASFNFNSGVQDWIGGFSDYPAGSESMYELSTGWSRLPVPLDTAVYAFKMSGNNHSDDLFMYMKYEVAEGLWPNRTYLITFEIDFASLAPTNAAGIGGAPGESVTLKVGALQTQPLSFTDSNGYILMNIDKGNQSTPGEDMIAIGHVGVSDTTTVYSMIHRSSKSQPVAATTDSNGALWIIIGVDSGFEGVTTLYFTNIHVVFNRV
jgi:hypothetical protein